MTEADYIQIYQNFRVNRNLPDALGMTVRCIAQDCKLNEKDAADYIMKLRNEYIREQHRAKA